MIKFKSFSSGSCGNCYFLGMFSDDRRFEGGILIDAGVSLRRLKSELSPLGVEPSDVSGVLVSHDHWDHIRSLGSYCKRLGIPVLAPPRLQRALVCHPGTGEYLADVRRSLSDGWNVIIPRRLMVRPFEVPHDASVTFGYAISIDSHRFMIMTDAGHVTDEAVSIAAESDTLVIESNYDPDMLRCGPYPPDLQERIRGGQGHLANGECAAALQRALHPGLRSVFLCHLSEHNNTPELALRSASEPLAGSGVRLVALPRTTASPVFEL